MTHLDPQPPPTAGHGDDMSTRYPHIISDDGVSCRCLAFAIAPDDLMVGAAWGRDCPAALREALATVTRERDTLADRLAHEEAAHTDTLTDRDRIHAAADALAYSIAPIEVIGEHSNCNDPWTNAIEALDVERSAFTARVAELEAHVGSLHKATASGRDVERAAVVAWLRGPAGYRMVPADMPYCDYYADAIARGEHHQEDDR